MSYVLFTPVGGHDPIASFHDGAVLHICRVYRPEKVYLYLSHEMLERSRQDDRYRLSLEKLQQQLGCKMEIHQIERDELTQVQLFDTFYTDFDQMRHEKYDGMIITGAPVEQMDFEEVTYWDEITEIFDWARTHVTSTLYICWAAQAGLYHHYGIPKYPLEEKMFGIFEHRVLEPFHSIFRGFDDCFYVPHSRHTEVRREDILKVPELTLLSESKEAGVYMAMARGGREFFVTGHSEYSPLTLDTEYRRDLDKGLPIEIPRNYYVDDDPEKGPLVRWRAHANLLFSNWLNYFVYQETPYNINDIK